MSCKLVYKIKKRLGGSIEMCNARLVVRGFLQQYKLDYDETFSSVANRDGQWACRAGPGHQS